MSATSPQFRLRWHRTWDAGDDFTGRDPDRPRAFARIYKAIGRPADVAWFWTASDEHQHLASGQTDTARKAAASAEGALFVV